MHIAYDDEVDALYIRFKETTVTTEHIGDGLAADYDADGRLAGLEILDAATRVGGGADALRKVVLQGLTASAA